MPIKPYDELTIQGNFIFQKVMRNKNICKKTIERLLDVSVKDISYPEEEKGHRLPPGQQKHPHLAASSLGKEAVSTDSLPYRGAYETDYMLPLAAAQVLMAVYRGTG